MAGSSAPLHVEGREAESPSTLAELIELGGGRDIPSFLWDRGGWERTTQAQMIADARELGAGLLSRGVRPGERVALLALTPAEAVRCFFAAILVGGVPIHLHPPLHLSGFRSYPRRLGQALEHLGPACLISSGKMRDLVGRGLDVPMVSPVELSGRGSAPTFAARPEDPAFLQLTSGTTVGTPRAVVLSNRAVLANVRAIVKRLGLRPRDVGYTWLPLFHDMGLVGCLLTGLYAQVVGVVAAPHSFARHPLGWLEDLARFRATVTAAPSFALHACAQAARRNGVPRGLDLSELRLLICGGEPIDPDAISAFDREFRGAGFRLDSLVPAYGLAEACLGVTMEEPGRATAVPIDRAVLAEEGRLVPGPADRPSRRVFSVGTPLEGVQMQLRDEAGAALRGEGRVGRVFVAGDSVMEEYYRDPLHTAESLCDGWLDTGDLGSVHQGRLFIVGRSKAMIILRGKNYNAEDLEDVAESVPGILKGAAVAVEDAPPGGGLLLIAETELLAPEQLDALARRVSDTLAVEAGIRPGRVVLLAPKQVPRTTSGKRQRERCRESVEQGRVTVQARYRGVERSS